jgi:hypothetical protein
VAAQAVPVAAAVAAQAVPVAAKTSK